MDQNEQNQYNIPAFQRRNSIDARARRASAPANKRVLIPAQRVEPFPQVIDRRPQHNIPISTYSARPNSSLGSSVRSSRPNDAYSNRPVVNRPGVRNMASEALESVIPGSVPKTLFQRIKGRMDSEDYDEYEDEDYENQQFEELQPLRRMQCVGICTMFFEKIQVIVIDLIAELSVGDRIILEGPDNTLFEQEVDTMQVNKKDIRHARKGQEVGTKVMLEPKLGGKVWKIVQ